MINVSMRPIVFDMSRLLSRAHLPSPSGIDRFEIRYADWIAQTYRSSVFVETLAYGPRIIERRRAVRMIGEVSRRWGAPPQDGTEQAKLQEIATFLDGEDRPEPAPPAGRLRRVIDQTVSGNQRRLQATLRRVIAKVVTKRQALQEEGRNALFVHVSHARLDRTGAFDWMPRLGARGIFYVHDLIPITHPNFARSGEAERHRRRLDTVLRHGAAILTNSEHSAAIIRDYAQAKAAQLPSVHVIGPGIEPAFRRSPALEMPETRRSFFLAIGTVEPRKNHSLLFETWRRLEETGAPDIPALVIAGRLGWNGDEVLAELDRYPTLRRHVVHVEDLGDAALCCLMRGARAVLSPTLVEGYGMPVVEALAAGARVVASDIPSHREIAGGRALLLDPAGSDAWFEAVERQARQAAPAADGLTGAARMARVLNWTDHFRFVSENVIRPLEHEAGLA